MRDFDHTSFGLFLEQESWVYAMAGKSRKNDARWGNTEFVNVTLTEPQRKEFKTWLTEKSETMPDEIGQLMVDDYKVSCNWDDNNQCFIATFTGKEDQSVNSAKALSSRSDDWYEALAINLFKHEVIFKRGKWSGETTRNNWG